MLPTLENRSPAASNPRNICVVTETYPPEINGVASTLAHLVNGLAARGHSVSLIRPSQGTSDSLAPPHCSEATLVHGLPLPGCQGLQFGIPAGGLLRRSWTRHPPDAVYVATEGPLGWSALRAARRLGIPAVSGFHTNFHNYCKHYRVGWMKHLALTYLRWFHNQSDRTLVSNEDLRNRLQAAGFSNVDILGRGVDSQLFTPQRRSAELRREWGLAAEDLTLMYVGRLAPEKNLDLAIETYYAMKRINGRVKFVIVGDGPLRCGLQRQHPSVIFAGTHIGERLAAHYASADVFLFASETETFGNVTLEAMASGLLVVAYNYAGAKVHITHGKTGFLVRYGDEKAFIESACRVVREPQSLGGMRRQAREYIIGLGWPRVVERFEALLMSAGGRSETESRSSLTRRGLAV